MGQSGIKQATVAIFGLRDVEDRSKSINPTNVSGNISVILDVQPNDETVTAIALTLGDETIQCRGTSADASSPVAGLAESGGQIEVDCFLDTDAVSGACVGMQLDPTYANGDYSLGAFVTTDEGNTRSVVATQPITLKNSGFVVISHEVGERSVVSETTEGLTFYGGPAVEGNVNSFHACPVSYKGTTVGELQLGTVLTNTARPDPEPIAFDEDDPTTNKVSFRRANGAPHYPIDDEAPFTWPISTTWWTGNGGVENVAGATEHWVEVIGLIKNADGLDVSGEFSTKAAGPFHFDFNAPRINQDGASAIMASGAYGAGGARASIAISDGTYLSDGSSSTRTRLIVSNVVENGVSDAARNIDMTEVIAVGDCSIAANTDNAARGTDFVAAFDDIRNITELPEDDAGTDLSDDGGLDCYVAELQGLEDALGNSTWLGGSTARVQSAGSFGVDRTGPGVRRLRPDESGLILSANEVEFESEDPELETGEDGSGIGGVVGQRYRAGRYRTEAVSATISGDDVTTDVSGLDDGSHDLRILVGDRARPTNWGAAFFEFVRDTKAPTFTAGSGPGQVSAGSSDRVTVTVSGSIRDANVIDEARLSVWANMGSQAVCGPDDSGDSPLPSSRVRAKDVENDSKRIDFEESFTIRKGAGGTETLCFVLDVTDVAVDASGDDDGANLASYTAGFFTVNWGLGITIDADASASGITLNDDGELEIPEGTTDATYTIVLDAQPAGLVTVTVGGHGDGTGVTTTDSTFIFGGTQADVDAATDDGAASPTLWNVGQTVTVNGADDARDEDDPEDAADDETTLTHSAVGGGYNGVSGSDVPVTVLDDDVALSVSGDALTAGGGAVTLTITATLARKVADDASDRSVSVAFAAGEDGDGGATIMADGSAVAVAGGTVTITIPAGMDVGTTTIEVTPGGTAGAITVGTGDAAGEDDGQVPATITIGA